MKAGVVPDKCRRRCVKFGNKRPSTKYATLFWNNFDPPSPVTLCHTYRDPLKWHDISDPQVLELHTYILTYIHTYIAYSHTYIHTYLHTHVYIYIHTHIYMPLQWVCIIVVGHGGALVEATTLNRRVVGSTPALAAM